MSTPPKAVIRLRLREYLMCCKHDYLKKKPVYEIMLKAFNNYVDFFKSIPVRHSDDPTDPLWINNWIPPFDGASIYTFLALNNPRFYVECGSGNTTKFAARAIKEQNLRTKIISIDPHPRTEIDLLCDTVFRMPFEDMDLNFFSQLEHFTLEIV